MLDMQAIFGNGTVPITAATAPETAALPEPTPWPEVAELPTPVVDPQVADVDEAPDFDSLPLPGDPCPKCQSLELWESMAGGWRCMNCNPPLAALRLLDRVSKLPARNQRSSIAPVALRRARSIRQLPLQSAPR
ncbi:MAG: hypothetical protein ABSA26_09660 [Thermoguttaceae bacterium]|jgi:hypothetical protein